MGIDQYVSSWEEGRSLNETSTADIMGALVAMSNSLRGDDSSIDLKKLKNAAERKEAEDIFYKYLEDKVKVYFDVETTDTTKISELIFSHYGIAPDIMGKTLEARQDRFMVAEVQRDLTERNNVYGYVQGINSDMRPRSKLTMDDKDEVIKYLKEKDDDVEKRIDTSRLTTTDHLAELLNQYLSEGAFTKSFLRGKVYERKEKEEEEGERERTTRRAA